MSLRLQKRIDSALTCTSSPFPSVGGNLGARKIKEIIEWFINKHGRVVPHGHKNDMTDNKNNISLKDCNNFGCA